MTVYQCAGLQLPSDEYVACYRAGHPCPPFVALHDESETHLTATYRCPCCGQHGMSMSQPKEWGDLVEVPADLHQGLILG